LLVIVTVLFSKARLLILKAPLLFLKAQLLFRILLVKTEWIIKQKKTISINAANIRKAIIIKLLLYNK